MIPSIPTPRQIIVMGIFSVAVAVFFAFLFITKGDDAFDKNGCPTTSAAFVQKYTVNGIAANWKKNENFNVPAFNYVGPRDSDGSKIKLLPLNGILHRGELATESILDGSVLGGEVQPKAGDLWICVKKK